jgi:demethylmenaquinone methyltransferase/2-methoxy-6-polyprenyl-1,4-benzoquinol methylase
VQKQEFIHKLFSRIAGKYDFLNDLMTLSLHRQWKQLLVKDAAAGIKTRGAKVLDLCTGTGDIAEIWIKNPNVSEVIGLDSCAPMLQVGYKNLEKKYNGPPPKLKMIEGDALEIPFPASYFDAVTVGFGLRNVSDLVKAIQEIHRVLKPGGIIASLDLGHPSIPLIESIYKKVFLKIIPSLGSSFASDKDAYQYLVSSLNSWPRQKDLTQGFYDMGFTRSYYRDLMLGSIAIVAAQK